MPISLVLFTRFGRSLIVLISQLEYRAWTVLSTSGGPLILVAGEKIFAGGNGNISNGRSCSLSDYVCFAPRRNKSGRRKQYYSTAPESSLNRVLKQNSFFILQAFIYKRCKVLDENWIVEPLHVINQRYQPPVIVQLILLFADWKLDCQHQVIKPVPSIMSQGRWHYARYPAYKRKLRIELIYIDSWPIEKFIFRSLPSHTRLYIYDLQSYQYD